MIENYEQVRKGVVMMQFLTELQQYFKIEIDQIQEIITNIANCVEKNDKITEGMLKKIGVSTKKKKKFLNYYELLTTEYGDSLSPYFNFDNEVWCLTQDEIEKTNKIKQCYEEIEGTVYRILSTRHDSKIEIVQIVYKLVELYPKVNKHNLEKITRIAAKNYINFMSKYYHKHWGK